MGVFFLFHPQMAVHSDGSHAWLPFQSLGPMLKLKQIYFLSQLQPYRISQSESNSGNRSCGISSNLKQLTGREQYQPDFCTVNKNTHWTQASKLELNVTFLASAVFRFR